MNRASPVDLRKALEAAKTLADGGILFVAVPVLSDYQALVELSLERLRAMEEIAKEEDI